MVPMKRQNFNFVLVSGCSIDGRICDSTGHYSHHTSIQDRRLLEKRMRNAACLIIGRVTYQHVSKRLPDKPTIVFSRKYNTMRQRGNIYWINPERFDVLKLLRTINVKSALILGGARTYAWFVEKNLINDLYITIEPKLFGAGKALLSIKGFHPKQLRLMQFSRIGPGGTLLLHYKNRRGK
jgi:dihydrofolate reductase